MNETPLILFGGSFDPIHNGHLRLASYVKRHLHAEVCFLVAKSPRWKKAFATNEQRFMMLKLGLASFGDSSFTYSDSELFRKGEVTYTIDTVKEFKEKRKDRPLGLLIGGDQAQKFPHWKEAKLLSELVKIYVIPRFGVEIPSDILSTYQMEVLPYFGGGTVSSTAIREGKSLDLPNEVLIYIEGEKLYFLNKISSFLSSSRYEHSLSVAHLSRQIASYNRLGEEMELLCYQAGLLHDIGKEAPQELTLSIMKNFYPKEMDLPSYAYHQFVGAYLANKECGENRKEVLKAIAAHCTGKKDMSPLSQILYSADKIDPGRGWDSSSFIKECFKDYHQGFLKVLKANREFLSKKEESENRLSLACYKAYL